MGSNNDWSRNQMVRDERNQNKSSWFCSEQFGRNMVNTISLAQHANDIWLWKQIKSWIKSIVKKDYGIKSKIITTRNPQVNAIVERIHQTIGNMIRTFELYNNDGMDDDDPLSGILAAGTCGKFSYFRYILMSNVMSKLHSFMCCTLYCRLNCWD
jgi:hypothetical protein